MNNKNKTVRRSRFEEIDDPYQYWKDEFDGLEEAYLDLRARARAILEELIAVTWDIGRAEVLRDQAIKDHEANNHEQQK